MQGWKSKRLGIRFELIDKELHLYHPDGSPFTSHVEEVIRAEEASKLAVLETKRANAEAKARQIEEQRADIAVEKLARLQNLLKEKGISLDDDI